MNESTESKVIHVVFGPGGGRIEPLPESEVKAIAHGKASEDTPVPSSREPVSDLFTLTEVAKLLLVSTGRLRALDKSGVVSPTGRRREARLHLQDIIALRAARDLLKKKVRLKDVARAIESIRKAIPKVTRPLAELSIVSDGTRVVLRSTSGSYEPVTGQMLLDFDVRSLRDDVVRVLRPTAGRERARTAYDLYVRASQFDEDPATLDEAERLYRRAIELDPWLAIAYTNLREHLLPSRAKKPRQRSFTKKSAPHRHRATRGPIQPRLRHARTFPEKAELAITPLPRRHPR